MKDPKEPKPRAPRTPTKNPKPKAAAQSGPKQTRTPAQRQTANKSATKIQQVGNDPFSRNTPKSRQSKAAADKTAAVAEHNASLKRQDSEGVYRGKPVRKLKVDTTKVNQALDENDAIADMLADDFSLNIFSGQGAKPELKKDHTKPLSLKHKSSKENHASDIQLRKTFSSDGYPPDRILRAPKTTSRQTSIPSPSRREIERDEQREREREA